MKASYVNDMDVFEANQRMQRSGAKPKSRRDDMIIAPGKRSATRGDGAKMFCSGKANQALEPTAAALRLVVVGPARLRPFPAAVPELSWP
jgi:hypothetical protein